MQLIVLVHGMWGNVQHFNYIVDQLKAAGAAAVNSNVAVPENCQLAVYCTQSNEGYFTYDGVDVCGLRVANEISNVVDSLAAQGAKVSEISVLGYSMGGPIARYAIGLLYTRGLFEEIKPRVFVTICSPHIGSNILGPSLSARLFNGIGRWAMARTSQQVFLHDRVFAANKPLFLVMNDAGTPWTKALQLFDRRVLYANVANDRRCSYYTSAAELEDPFAGVDLNNLAGPFVPGFEPVVLDSVNPVFSPPPPKKPAHRGFGAWLWNRTIRSAKLVLLAAQIGVVVPLWFMAFCVNASYQYIASRLRTHALLRSGIHLPDYDLSQQLEDRADDIVEDVYSTIGREAESPRLALTPTMHKLIEQFNVQRWEKYPICIRDTAQAHAAAIMRHTWPSFWEGAVMVKHLMTVLLDN